MKSREIDFETIKNMSEEQQQQVYYTLAKRANQRFRDIKKSGYETTGAINKAKKFLEENFGRDTFVQSKKLTGLELKESMEALETFYNSKTASVQGIRKLEKERIEQFAEKGIEIKDKKKFFQFLSSQQFKTLSKYADSDQVIEDFTNASDEGFSYDEIMSGYDDFLNSEMTFEQVAERRSNGGELLH